MIDINYSLRIAYMTALTGIVPDVYYQSLPANLSPDNYIIFGPISNNDGSTKSSSDTETSMPVTIHTKDRINNPGLSVDILAKKVFDAIYPNSQAALVIDGGQVVKTRMQSDVTQDAVKINNDQFISRTITFGHTIWQRADIS